MDSIRMIKVYNASRKFLGYPKILVILDDALWDIPVNVSKDPTFDGWYTDTGDAVDPSDFWKTKEIDVTIAITQSSDVSFRSVGEADEAFVTYYSLIENKDVVQNAYGFIIDKDIYKLEEFNILPTPSNGVLIEFQVKKWD